MKNYKGKFFENIVYTNIYFKFFGGYFSWVLP